MQSTHVTFIILMIMSSCCTNLMVRAFMPSSKLVSSLRGGNRRALSMFEPANPPKKAKKFIVVTGGVISGIGKGVTASSIGVLMKMMNIRPTAIKIDPYLNVDAGTMSPFEHGEVFVLDDGGETDLDLGNYERFLDVRLTSDSNLTTGKCYQAVIAKERKGEYLGKTVQIIPHVTNEIMERIIAVSESPVDDSHNEPDVCVIELGGTIGDIESMPFVEALRQLQLKVAPEDFCLIHVSMVPIIGESGEQKTKPTQHSVKELRSLGLAPDFIVCRSPVVVETGSREKIALFCNVPKQNVLSIHDVRNIYHVPLLMLQQDLHTLIRKRLLLDEITSTRSQPQSVEPTAAAAAAAAEDSLSPPSLLPSSIVSSAGLNQAVTRSWERMTARIDATKDEAVIALVGKYTINKDAYLSVIFALRHACMGTDQKLRLEMIESSHLEEHTKQNDPDLYVDAWRRLKAADGVLVPGGFGVRGVEGKVDAIRYVRESKVPFLGICLGMQVAVIEYTRSFLGRAQANSREFEPESSEADAAIIFMPEGSKDQMGGTMRLGVRQTLLSPDSRAAQLYGGAASVDERHRHRYEVNPPLVPLLEAQGLRFSGRDETAQRMEIVELDPQTHPYFVAVQFHPEFKSRPQRPSPVFLGLLQAVKDRKASGAK